MKNSLLILAASALTYGACGFLVKPQVKTITIKPTVHIDTLKNKLDSLEEYKTKTLNKYVTEIQVSFEAIKNEKKKQEELDLSADSIFDLVSLTDSVNNTLTIK